MQEYIIAKGIVKGKLVSRMRNGTEKRQRNAEAIEFSGEMDYNSGNHAKGSASDSGCTEKEGDRMQENDALQIQLRKNQDTLKIVGLGVMVFGVWSIVKTILYTTAQWSSITEEIVVPEANATLAKMVYLFMIAVTMVVEIAVRLYIGRSAIAEGRGERRRPGYIAVAFLIAFLGLALTASAIVMPGIHIELNLDLLASLFVEITSAVITFEMCWSAVRVRKLRRQLAERE